jgi:hypothetical protein
MFANESIQRWQRNCRNEKIIICRSICFFNVTSYLLLKNINEVTGLETRECGILINRFVINEDTIVKMSVQRLTPNGMK